MKIKATYMNVTRRVDVSRRLPFQAVLHILARRFHLCAESCKITFLDEDEDEITVASEQEWVWFVSEAKNHVLRVNIDGNVVCGGRRLLSRVVRQNAFVWRVRNDSDVAWPVRVALVHVGGTTFSAVLPQALALDNRAEPEGGECDVVLRGGVWPTEPGSYRGVFRLVDADSGRRFGQRMVVTTVVTDVSIALAKLRELGFGHLGDETLTRVFLSSGKNVGEAVGRLVQECPQPHDSSL